MKMKLLIGLAVLGSAAIAADLRPPEFRLPLLAKEPTIDGCVGVEEWKGSVGSFGFVKYPTDTVEPIGSSFFIGRTATRLYVAGFGKVGPYGLKAGSKPRHGNVTCGADDTYEIVLVPDNTLKSPDVRHIIVNFNGAYQTQASLGGAMAAWIPETMETKSTIRDGWWHFEWSVSLAEIGFDKAPSDRHALRFCRNFKGVYSQWGYQSSMRPNESGFFAAGKTIPLVFDDSAVAARLFLGDTTDPGRWNLRLRLDNTSARAASVEAVVEGRPVNSQPGVTLKTVSLAAGESAELPVTGPILGDEKVDLKCAVEREGKVDFFRQVIWHPNEPPIEWLKPGDAGGAVKLDFAYYPSHDQMRVRADLSSLEKRPSTVRLTLRSDVDRGTKVLAERTFALDREGIADEIWPVPDLKAETLRTGVGGYTLTLDARGVRDGHVVRAFRRDVFPWEGFKGGTSATIPSRFTPVKVEKAGDNEKVSVVLREHLVEKNTGLWQQVIAAGKPLLARPMRLMTNGTEATSRLSQLSHASRWDVDGLMVWQLHLAPGDYAPFSLEIPIRSERARLLHACADGMRFNYAGVVPAGRGRVWDSSKAPRTSIIGDYVPYVWVGGPLRGLAVFGENDKGWVTAAKHPCQEIIREADGTVVLRLNLIQHAVTLTEPRMIKIGFMATPVKPMERDWRSKDIGNLIGSCYYWGGFTASDEIHPYDGTDTFWRKMGEVRRTGKVDRNYVERAIAERVYHCPTNSPRFADTYRCFKAHFWSGMNNMANACGHPETKFVWYTNGRGVRLGNPEGTTFADEWTVEPFAARPFAWDASKSYSLDPNRSYLDFAAYWWEKALSLGCVDYYYWDDIFCQSNFDLVGTDAYRTADGDIQPASGLFNMREQVKRCAVLQAEHGWIDDKNWVHMTNTALAPVLSFAGMNYDWEDVAGDSAIQERYGRAAIQAQSLGRQFGNQVAVMGYFATKDPKSDKLKWLERTGTGACLTHELRWNRVKVWQAAHQRLVDWGYRQPTTRVWNYWDEDAPFPVVITGGENAALAMRRADGEVIVIVSDWDKGGSYTLAPDLQALGLSSDFEVRNLETGESLPTKDGKITLKLARLDYAIVIIRKTAALGSRSVGGGNWKTRKRRACRPAFQGSSARWAVRRQARVPCHEHYGQLGACLSQDK